jgi:hypothetical protein
MSYFTFQQNNSGGFYKGPAATLVVEAGSANEANVRAVALGVYFDERDDCIECCGYRWDKVHDDDAAPLPSIWGEPIDFTDSASFYMRDLLVVRLDGVKFRTKCER